MSDTTKKRAPSSELVRAVLVLGVPGHGSSAYELPLEGIVTLGRELPAQIVVRSELVSRSHARIHGGTPPSIEDLGSSNGTKVSGRRLVAGERVPLALGAVVEVGDVVGFVQAAAPGVAPLAQVFEPADAPKAKIAEDADVVVSADPRMRELFDLAAVIGPSVLSVLILGETGVGKDVYATRLHAHSARRGGALVRLNCAAVPESLLEAELFGYERGAFTGAVQAKPGLLETADGGTFFLDEIGEMPLPTQAKLLRVLESGEVQRLGAVKPRRIDVRFLAATHQNLEALVDAGKFRMDLFFRLNGITVELPPLRARPADILPIARALLPPGVNLSDEVRAKLQSYAYPGNVRELKNVVARAVVLAQKGPLRPEHVIFSRVRGTGAPPPPMDDERAAPDDPDRERILAAMDRLGGNQKRVAEELGIPRTTLIRKLAKYGPRRP